MEQVQEQKFNWISNSEEREQILMDRDLRVVRRMIEGECNPKIYLKHSLENSIFQITDTDSILDTHGTWDSPSGEFLVIPFIPDFQYLLDTFRTMGDKKLAEEAIHFLLKTDHENSFKELLEISFYSDIYFQIFPQGNCWGFPHWNIMLLRGQKGSMGRSTAEDDHTLSIVNVQQGGNIDYIIARQLDLATELYTEFDDYWDFATNYRRDNSLFLDIDRCKLLKARIMHKSKELLRNKYLHANQLDRVNLDIEKEINRCKKEYEKVFIKFIWRFARQLKRVLYLEVDDDVCNSIREIIDSSINYRVEVTDNKRTSKIIAIRKVEEEI